MVSQDDFYEASKIDDETDDVVQHPSPVPSPQRSSNHDDDSSPDSSIRKTRSLREHYEVSELVLFTCELQSFEVANKKRNMEKSYGGRDCYDRERTKLGSWWIGQCTKMLLG